MQNKQLLAAEAAGMYSHHWASKGCSFADTVVTAALFITVSPLTPSLLSSTHFQFSFIFLHSLFSFTFASYFCPLFSPVSRPYVSFFDLRYSVQQCSLCFVTETVVYFV
jgi:hypothetical protein